MREVYGDAWEMVEDSRTKYNTICILTNGNLDRNGDNVMGRGIARQAKQKHPELPRMIGQHLRLIGNSPLAISGRGIGARYNIVTFPTKHSWKDDSDIELIKESAVTLNALAEENNLEVLLPRPGCGNGGLKWSEVRQVLEEVLGERVTVVSFR